MRTTDFAFAVLAAGESKRFGEEKMLYPYKGKPLLQGQIDKFSNLDIPLFMVIKPSLIKKINERNFNLLINENYSVGISSSLKLLFNSVKDKYDGVIIILGDMPSIEIDDIKRIKFKAEEYPDKFIYFVFDGIKGFPTYIPSKCFLYSHLLKKDVGAYTFVRKNIIDFMEIEGNERNIYDIDTKNDIKKGDGK